MLAKFFLHSTKAADTFWAMKIVAIIVGLFFWGAVMVPGASAAESHPNPVVVERPALNKQISSPDKRFTIWLEKSESANSRFRMKDNATSQVVTIFDAPKGVSLIGWTGDSRTLVAVILLAGGPVGIVFHQNESGAWMENEVSPPQVGFQKQCVVDCRLMESNVRFTYAVMRNINQADAIRRYHCSFNVDAVSGQFSDMKWKELSDKEFMKNHRRFFMD